MKRLRFLFAIILFLIFFPMWRNLDYLSLIWPSAPLYSMAFTLTVILFITVPLQLIRPDLKKIFHILIILLFASLALLGGTLSSMATQNSEFRHCGFATYSGFLTPIKSILPPAHHDDVEVRNQMCWLRKMIVRMPEKIEDVNELKDYLDIIRQKLLTPTNKYRATLPFIAILHGKMSANLQGSALESVEIGKMFVDSLHFWKGQYTMEISAIAYPWYAWPHSAYIQFEYGLIERNWENLVEGIRLETN